MQTIRIILPLRNINANVKSGTTNFLGARFKLSLASYLSESNFTQKAVVSFHSKFSQQKFTVWQQRW